MNAGAGLFKGATGNNNTSGPDGVMTVLHREIWAGDGDSTLKFLSLANGAFLGQISTGGQFRVDEMCFDPVHNIGFVANNADNPAFITAVNFRTHSILGKIVFDGTPQNGGGIGVNATDGIEQCQFNPRDGMIYVSVPEVNGPGDNSAPGAVARINPVTMQIVAAPLIPLAACSGPQGLAIGPVVGTFGEMLTGCNGANANAAANRPTALVDDGTSGGTFGASVSLSWQAGNDMVAYNSGDNHYYLARSGNNSVGQPECHGRRLPAALPGRAGLDPAERPIRWRHLQDRQRARRGVCGRRLPDLCGSAGTGHDQCHHPRERSRYDHRARQLCRNRFRRRRPSQPARNQSLRDGGPGPQSDLRSDRQHGLHRAIAASDLHDGRRCGRERLHRRVPGHRQRSMIG